MPVRVVALKGSPQIASASRYCGGLTEVAQPGSLHEALRKLSTRAERPLVLFIDNDSMMKTLEAHAAELRVRCRAAGFRRAGSSCAISAGKRASG